MTDAGQDGEAGLREVSERTVRSGDSGVLCAEHEFGGHREVVQAFGQRAGREVVVDGA